VWAGEVGKAAGGDAAPAEEQEHGKSASTQEVKLPIASSLHEIAKVLGPVLAQSLFPIVDQLLHEELEEVQLAVVSIFADFVAVFEEPTRETLIDFFLVLQKEPKRWRIRYQIAKQLGVLSGLYGSDTNFQYIFPINLKLCNDTHSLVREEAASHIHQVVLRMEE
jgi:hypothetical protein